MSMSTLHRPEYHALHDVMEINDELAARLPARLYEVDRRLRAAVACPTDPRLDIASAHLASAGGKQMRPLLALLGAEFGNPDAPDVITGAVVVELAHLASLYHDDVMDEAPTRRGVVTANARWGNAMAVLAGDYLLAKGAELSAMLGIDVLRAQATALGRLVQGQVRETAGPLAGVDPRTHYFEVIRDKTASLLALAIRLGGITAGADRSTIDALASYAEALGVAFQISDDILDIAASSAASGKLPGIDLLHGLMTLPVLYALQESPDAAELSALLAEGTLTDQDQLGRALAIIRDSSAIARSQADLRCQVDVAQAALAGLPHVPARQALVWLCDYVVGRTAEHALASAI